MSMTWKWPYAAAAIVVFLIEVGIALFVHDGFVRPHLGDSLAVVLVYLGMRAVTRLRPLPAALTALTIAVVIEISQYFHFVTLIGLGHNRWARIVLGGVFDVQDIVAYVVGAIAIVAVERLRGERLA